jgi:hypothetical protein
MQWNFSGFIPVDRYADDSGQFVLLHRPGALNFESLFYGTALRRMTNGDKQYAIRQGLITPELVDKFRTE